MRRAIAGAAGVVLGLSILAGTAHAQEPQSPATIETTTTAVAGTSTTNTTTTTTEAPTTTEAEETTTTAVAPDSVARPTTPPAVRGDVVSRPLPRTGSDLNGTALFGGALTVVGIALALGARRRRNAYDG